MNCAIFTGKAPGSWVLPEGLTPLPCLFLTTEGEILLPCGLRSREEPNVGLSKKQEDSVKGTEI